MSSTALYGAPAAGLVEVQAGAIQVAPLIPGSTDLADLAEASLDAVVMLAPAGTLERDYALAQALRALRPGGTLSAFAPKDKGGARLRKALEPFGCVVVEDARKHHRFCQTTRPMTLSGLEAAIAAGAPQLLPALGLWSQPGVFSWDRIDPGSAALISAIPRLAGRGADLGCGVGVLAAHVLGSPAVEALACIDIDRRAIACARHNLNDPRVSFHWSDACGPAEDARGLDFVVMNPPFHAAGSEDRSLGVAFIRAAGARLRKGGVCWLVANRHLPYEAPLAAAFASFAVRADLGGYKVIEARK